MKRRTRLGADRSKVVVETARVELWRIRHLLFPSGRRASHLGPHSITRDPSRQRLKFATPSQIQAEGTQVFSSRESETGGPRRPTAQDAEGEMGSSGGKRSEGRPSKVAPEGTQPNVRSAIYSPSATRGRSAPTCIRDDTILPAGPTIVVATHAPRTSGATSRFAPCPPLRSAGGAKARGRTEARPATRSKETPSQLASVW
jgi:hypothetical protein